MKFSILMFKIYMYKHFTKINPQARSITPPEVNVMYKKTMGHINDVKNNCIFLKNKIFVL